MYSITTEISSEIKRSSGKILGGIKFDQHRSSSRPITASNTRPVAHHRKGKMPHSSLLPLSTRFLPSSTLTLSRSISSSLRSLTSSSHPSNPPSNPSEPSPTTPSRQIGKVSRPARQKPLPTGPPVRKHPKPFPPLLPRTPTSRSLERIPAIRNRPTLINGESCRDLVRAWGIDRMGENVTVVDTYAGAGKLSEAFLELENVKRVICIEDAFRYSPQLRVSLFQYFFSARPGFPFFFERASE